MKILPVLDMFRIVNMRGGVPSFPGEPRYKDKYCTAKTDVFFIHGFKVSEESAKGWHSEFFKRLHQSGSNARFFGVTWKGDISENLLGSAVCYHLDVSNAFVTAGTLVTFLSENAGRLNPMKTVLAHSLGNMVASAALQAANCFDNYLMLNAAVPAEAYDGRQYLDPAVLDKLIHVDWRQYDKRCFSSSWYNLWPTGDNRRKLTWQDRFQGLSYSSLVYNYYSEDDEVFMLIDAGNVSVGAARKHFPGAVNLVTKGKHDGGLVDLSAVAWQKQELYKGADSVFFKDSSSAGWAFVTKKGSPKKIKGEVVGYYEIPKYSPVEVLKLTDDDLRKDPLFMPSPDWVFVPDKVKLDRIMSARDGLLACAIPAISKPMGIYSGSISRRFQSFHMLNMKNGWGRNDFYNLEKWLHCDIKDMGYFYISDLFDDFVKKGRLGNANE